MGLIYVQKVVKKHLYIFSLSTCSTEIVTEIRGFLYLQMGEEKMAWISGNLQLITLFFIIWGT